MSQQLYLNRQRFTEALRARGFRTINEFAAHAGIHRNSISQYLNQERGVFSDLFERICRTLNVSEPLSLLTDQVDNSGTLNEVRLKSLLEPLATKNMTLAFVLIGSRAKGEAREHSDWDIGVTGGIIPLTTDQYLELKSEIQDLTDNFAQSCDVINLDAAPSWFIDDMNYEPQFLAGNRESFSHLLGLIHGYRKARKDIKGSRAA